MAGFVAAVVNLDEVQLSVVERNLLPVAYNNLIGARRASWRIISSIEKKEENKGNAVHLQIIRDYRSKIEKEMNSICCDILSVLEKLIPATTDAESKHFYLKMKGDYYRYMAEYKVDDEHKDASDKSLAAYKAAMEAEHLPPTHPLRLGMALSFSVFMYEILNSPEQACVLARNAFNDALAEIDSLEEENYKESTLLMQLLRDNLTQWTSSETSDSETKEKTET